MSSSFSLENNYISVNIMTQYTDSFLEFEDAMLGRLHPAEFKSIPQKILPCGLDEVFPYVPPEYRTPGLASLRRFQKGCH